MLYHRIRERQVEQIRPVGLKGLAMKSAKQKVNTGTPIKEVQWQGPFSQASVLNRKQQSDHSFFFLSHSCDNIRISSKDLLCLSLPQQRTRYGAPLFSSLVNKKQRGSVDQKTFIQPILRLLLTLSKTLLIQARVRRIGLTGYFQQLISQSQIC